MSIVVLATLCYCFSPKQSSLLPQNNTSRISASKQETTPATSVSDALQSDVRLRGNFSFTTKCIELKVLLKQIATQCRVSISVDNSLRNQKLQMRIKERAIPEIMISLCTLLQAEWEQTDEGGYILRRTTIAKHYADHWWDLCNLEREKARQDTIKNILYTIQDQTPHWDALDGVTDAHERRGIEKACYSAQLWQNLPVSAQNEIANTFTGISFYRRIPYNSIGSNEGGIVLPLEDLSPACRAALTWSYLDSNSNAAPQEKFLSGVHLIILGDCVYAAAILTSGIETSIGEYLQIIRRQEQPAFWLDHKPLLDLPKDTKIPKHWQELIAYQRATVWHNAPPRDKIGSVDS